jgi:hypothetical protein
MKLHVIGFEINEGTSAKTGKPYSIGKLYTVFPLAGASKPETGNVARGASCKEFRCEVGILRKIEHLHPPMTLDAEMAEVMRFGELSQDIVKLTPLDVPAKPVPGREVRAA